LSCENFHKRFALVDSVRYKYMLEKPEEAIKNGQSRDTGNIGYTRHRTKANKTKTRAARTPPRRVSSFCFL